ncbi:Germin [Macleaya cordata]|uniref:Germin-like protein n=1 Tax=Macleaya cordata TaxID=56857 RepID=A0A200QNF0_MACCD|nr:Germin [Macleaya cordata]
MATIRSSTFFLIFSRVVVVFFTSPCFSDPDALQDFCVADLNAATSVNGFPCKPDSQVSSSDFFFSGLSMEGNTANLFGVNVTAGNVLSFPGLNTLGISMNRVDYAPGGVNPLHSHPRATEAGVIILGEVLVGFITTRNVLYSKVLKTGEMFVIPKGLVHFQKNVGPGKALTLTAFNSQNPGAVILPTNLFASNPTIPNEILAKNFQVDETVITGIKSKFGSS